MSVHKKTSKNERSQKTSKYEHSQKKSLFQPPAAIGGGEGLGDRKISTPSVF